MMSILNHLIFGINTQKQGIRIVTHHLKLIFPIWSMRIKVYLKLVSIIKLNCPFEYRSRYNQFSIIIILIKIYLNWGEKVKNGSVVKSTCFSCRGPEFGHLTQLTNACNTSSRRASASGSLVPLHSPTQTHTHTN